ncbi:MAG: hypothetical protein WCL02_05030 [bacterium]
MKNLLKVGALSLALVASVFVLNTNASQQGDLTLKITGTTGSCDLGLSSDIGTYAFSYNAQTASGVFNATTSNTPTWYCNDTNGSTPWRVELSSTDVANITTNNAAHTVPAANVFVKNDTATKVNGTCTPNVGASQGTRQSIATPVVLFGKSSATGEVCKVETQNVGLQVDLTGSQALGQYSGTLTIDLLNFMP